MTARKTTVRLEKTPLPESDELPRSEYASRVWYGYKEQYYLWRAICLLQIPATILGFVTAVWLYYHADITVAVPPRPNESYYTTAQLPDSQFLDAATVFVDLISTYEAGTARRRFLTARRYLWEPAFTEFEETMMTKELDAIEETKRSQMFFINPRLIKVARFPEHDKVVVRIPGVRQKLIGNKPLPADQMVYDVKMTTIPRNVHNEYGIVIVDIRLRAADDRQLGKEDMMEMRQESRPARRAQRDGAKDAGAAEESGTGGLQEKEPEAQPPQAQ